MQVAVIGGGVIGVCTAYFLVAAGHEVVVIERAGNVAQGTSFGNAGIVSPGYNMAPWSMPGMPQKLFSYLFKAESPVLLNKKLDPALWRWIRRWISECDLKRFRINRERMHRITLYSNELLTQLRDHHELDYEQTKGMLQLFRSQQELKFAQPALEMIAESGIAHRLLDIDSAREIEPALGIHTTMVAALHFPQDGAGNCPLFTRQLKNLAQSMGAEFHFNSKVEALQPEGNKVALTINGKIFNADAVVVAAGAESARLLEPLGIRVPMYPVKSYSATASIKNFDQAPLASLIDETYKVAITRMGSRIRLAGTVELGSSDSEIHASAMRTLVKVGEDWFPDAANYNAATFWAGTEATLPDGPPVVGPTPIRNVYVNIGHGASGWAMAPGSGKIVADLISEKALDISLDGLTYARYG